MTSSSSSSSQFVSLNLSDAYRILEVTSSANTDEIKSAYKRLALKSHPDKNPHDPFAHQKFVKISEAYKQLCESSPAAESDEDDEDDDEEQDEHDHDFAFRMFEKMFFGKHGNKIKGRKISGGFMFSSRHECDCPHCRCYSKPKTPYIPKSQRPKDPNASKDTTNDVTEGAGAGVDDWLEDIEIHTRSQKKTSSKTSSKKKSTPKKKSSNDISHEPSKEKKTELATPGPEVISEPPKETKKTRRDAKRKAAAAAALQAAKDEVDDEDDDAITAEDMATTLGYGRHSRKEIVTHPRRQENPRKNKVEKNLNEKAVEIPGLNQKKTIESISSEKVIAKSSTQSLPEKPATKVNESQPLKKEVAFTSASASKPKRPPLDPQPTSNKTKANTRGAKDSSTPAPYLYTRQLKVLLEMGFLEEPSRVALEKSVGNVDLATSFLIQYSSEPETVPFPSDNDSQPSEQSVISPPSSSCPPLQSSPPSPPPSILVRKTPPTPLPPAPAPLPIPLPLFDHSSVAPFPNPHLGPSTSTPPTTSSSSHLLDHLSLDPHSDTDFDDLLLVPSSYESFTNQLQQQIDFEAKNSSTSSLPSQLPSWCQRGEEMRSVAVTSSIDMNSNQSLALGISGASSSASSSLPSFLSSHESRLESDLFPSLGQIFTHEPPTLQLFHQTPQLFQSELFIGSSPSASSTVSSVSLVSGDTLDDHLNNMTTETNTATAIQQKLSTTTTSLSSPSTSTPTTAVSQGSTTATVTGNSMTGAGVTGVGAGVGSIPACVYFNTSRGCRNSTNCKFLHSLDSEKTKDHSSSSTPIHTSSSSSSASRTRSAMKSSSSRSNPTTAKVCAFYPTPAGCKLGNSCKFLHQR